MSATSRTCAERLRSRFGGLVPSGNSETLYLRPIIEEARKIIWAETLLDPKSGPLARATEQRLMRALTGHSYPLGEPLVSTAELRAILLEAIDG